MTPTAGLLLGGRYELTERLAIGGMGEVWVATDLHLRRHVAAKVLRSEFAGDGYFLDRLRTEARNSAALSHQNIAAMYDYGEQRGSGYLIMELVLGESLEDLLRREKTLEPAQILPILAQTARALHTAHISGVVHRDVKPSNILLTRDGYAKITDFGISLGANQAPMTAAGMVMGTAQYLPPEQAMGRAATGAGDVYALGVVAFEALVGHRPFTGGSQVDIAFAHVNQPIPELPTHLDDRVREAVIAMLAKDPEERPRSAASLARMLETLAQELRTGSSSGGAHTGTYPGSADDEDPPATSISVVVAAPAPVPDRTVPTPDPLVAQQRVPELEPAPISRPLAPESEQLGDEEFAPRWRPLSGTNARVPRHESATGRHRSDDQVNRTLAGDPAPSDPPKRRRDLRQTAANSGKPGPAHRPIGWLEQFSIRTRWIMLIVAAIVLTALFVALFSRLGATAATAATSTALIGPISPLPFGASARVKER